MKILYGNNSEHRHHRYVNSQEKQHYKFRSSNLNTEVLFVFCCCFPKNLKKSFFRLLFKSFEAVVVYMFCFKFYCLSLLWFYLLCCDLPQFMFITIDKAGYCKSSLTIQLLDVIYLFIATCSVLETKYFLDYSKLVINSVYS